MPRPERTIGAASPFALTEMILGKRINWRKIESPKEVVQKRLRVKRYEDLFDPETSKILYSNNWINDQGRVHIEGFDKDFGPRTSVQYLGIASSKWLDAGHFLNEWASYRDPMQGGLLDCPLISLLISMAFCDTTSIAHRSEPPVFGAAAPYAGLHRDVITVWPTLGSRPEEKAFTQLLEVNLAGLIHARSMDSGEIWPGMYEKAFAIIHNKPPSGDQPEMLAANRKLPDMTIFNFTGKIPSSYFMKNSPGGIPEYSSSPGFPDPVRLDSPEEALRQIGIICGVSPKLPISSQATWGGRDNLISKRPGVAATHMTLAPPLEASDILVAQHCYAVLGMIWTHPMDDIMKIYVVLRNPFALALPPYPPRFSSTCKWVKFEDQQWKFSDVIQGGNSVNVNVEDTFAMPLSEFMKYFAGIFRV